MELRHLPDFILQHVTVQYGDPISNRTNNVPVRKTLDGTTQLHPADGHSHSGKPVLIQQHFAHTLLGRCDSLTLCLTIVEFGGKMPPGKRARFERANGGKRRRSGEKSSENGFSMDNTIQRAFEGLSNDWKYRKGLRRTGGLGCYFSLFFHRRQCTRGGRGGFD